ncbi:hypothetical protein LAZ67_20000766 [Cordylochernes scorpioides]|uniref:EF-hand domain-containing protein n=1 Tax=Cordylochernes scorpioides TaxID=51811 RepID=A0ABY6LLQ9_9ARAC|nr:hypothetical protein LAZ67_20000766 [Cordylochernes scorpioides]
MPELNLTHTHTTNQVSHLYLAEFRDCFSLNARSGQIRSIQELTATMRSLGLSPTVMELNKYFNQKNGKISFAEFLEILHDHSQKEDIPEEVLKAFRACDRGRSGQIHARELRRILLSWGERLSQKEIDAIYREANVNPNGYINYSDFVRIICAPVPDYY